MGNYRFTSPYSASSYGPYWYGGFTAPTYFRTGGWKPFYYGRRFYNSPLYYSYPMRQEYWDRYYTWQY